MNPEHISVGAVSHRNDDHVAIFTNAGVADILVIDGGTSVAERDYLDPVVGDVAWFVHAFTAALQAELQPDRSQQDCVHAAVKVVRAAFEGMPAHATMPLYAWPIAALTWVRIEVRNSAQHATVYALGDCKSLLRTASGACTDLDPFVNPQDAVLQAEIAKLRMEGLADPVVRRERMLPMLRARREFQNSQAAPAVLCLRPHGAFHAREQNLDLEPGASLLIMTDGFYRLVDPYGLYTDAGLMDACHGHGMSAMLDELRSYEAVAGATGARAVKAADDASAVLWRAS